MGLSFLSNTGIVDIAQPLLDRLAQASGELVRLSVVDGERLTWVARAAGLGKNWNELAAKGLITPFEVKQLQRNEGLLKLIRARLHVIAGRRDQLAGSAAG